MVQTPLGTRPGLGTQPQYKAPSDLQVKMLKRSDQHQVCASLSRQYWPKVDHRTAK